ncbi:MAG: biotin/lipoyl-binding protein [Magnetococcus sp. DMHC-6]
MTDTAPQESGKPPPLREELHLFPGPNAIDGAPTWTLLDPANNQFFRIGWREFEILCRWRRGGPSRIAELVSTETTLETTTEDVQNLTRFLLESNLLRPQGERGLARLNRHVQATKQSWFQQILHAYLFFRIPLFDPDRLLRKTLPKIQWIFSKKFFIATGIAALIGLHFITRQWEVAMATFSETDTLMGLIFITIALFLTKAVHELGHAFTAIRYGCHVPTIGVAFLVLLPVLYTDTSDVWKLVSRQHRLAVGAAGILSELILTAWASLIWGLLPLGGAKDALFYVATVSWISTLILNTSPFLRFDGYYLLSDWLGIENLHDRAGQLGRWKLREVLFKLGAPFPDAALFDRARFLIFFAWLTWSYRFFLFFGIAIAVYHLFFKALGIFLMSIEIGWFLFRPIIGEIKAWMRPEINIKFNSRVFLSSFVLVAILWLMTIPWIGSIHAPAMLRRAQQVTLYTPMPAQITTLSVRKGDFVKQGQILLQLDAPELDNQINLARIQIELSRWKLAFRGNAPKLLELSSVVSKELEVQQSQYNELNRQKKRLTVTAPFDGTITRLGDDIKNNVWIGASEPLLEMSHASQWQLIAFVRETDLGLFDIGNSGIFLPEGLDWEDIACQIIAVSPVGTTLLDEPALVPFQGGVPARRDDKGQWQSTTAVYRIVLKPTTHFSPPPHILRGTVIIESNDPLSLFSLIQRTAIEIFVRETSF